MKLLLAGGTGLIGQAFLACAQSTKLHITERTSGQPEWPPRTSLPTLTCRPCPQLTRAHSALRLGRGSQDAFRALDFDAVIAFAAAISGGSRTLLTVTAVGANPNSSVFYSRVKGEVERELSSMHFQRLDIVQPGLLLGNRTEKRPLETLLKWMAPGTDLLMQGPWRKYRSIAAHTVAESLLVLTTHSAPGLYIHQHDDIRELVAGAP